MNNHPLVSIAFLTALFILSSSCFGQWEPDVRLTDDPAESRPPQNNARSIAAYGSLVIVVWTDSRDGSGEIYFKRSKNGGTTWEKDRRLTNNPNVSVNPSVSISGSVVHLVWEEDRNGNNEIYYKRSLDKGETWGQDQRLTNDSASSLNPSLATTGPNLHIVWQDNRDGVATNENEVDNYEVYYKSSKDSGRSWHVRSLPASLIQRDKRLTQNIGHSYLPGISASGSNVHVVWSDARENNFEIFYKRSTDGGLHWDPDRRLTNTSSPSTYPSICAEKSSVHVVWQEYLTGNREIFYKRSPDTGTTWGEDTRLTNNSSISSSPSIATLDRGVHVVWADYRDGNEEIYYKRSRDDGITWGPDTRLTNSPGYSTNPGVSVTGKAVHVMWVDFRDGNPEIYYKRNQTGNTN